MSRRNDPMTSKQYGIAAVTTPILGAVVVAFLPLRNFIRAMPPLP